MAETEDPQAASRHRDVIERQTESLSRLIDDLLDVARVTYGKVSLRPEAVDLGDILRASCQSLEPSFRASGVEFTSLIAPTMPVRGDRVRLEQVFANLLQNALKYTPQGGSVAVTATASTGVAIVSVKDSGIGLDDKMLCRVFELFTQVDRSLERARGGLGIGLTLVRSLVQLHGGTVQARSAGLGRGSEFLVELPLGDRAPVRVAEQERESLETAARAPARVVVVEDGEDLRGMLKELLEMRGHSVSTAADGAAGIERILAASPDVAFVDIGLPEVDGYEVARQVRAGGCRALLVALTGYGQDDDRRQAAAAGFDRHLTKPVDLNDLEKVMVGIATRRDRTTPVEDMA
jgi:CheY-like chemotaxis protein